MKYCIVVSRKDLAGMNIMKNLLDNYDFEKKKDYYVLDNIKLIDVDKDSVYCDNLDKKIAADFFIFATKHQSKSQIKTFSVHVPGNWSESCDLGGKPNTLNIAPGSLMKEMFIELNNQGKKLSDFEITLETTHHGPFLEKPVMFIEIGSSIEEWQNLEAGKIIAKTIMNVLKKDIKNYETCLGLGGSHYPHSFNKFLLRTEYALANICPKYMLDSFNEEMLEKGIKNAVEKIEKVAVDWKGLGKHKKKVVDLIESKGFEIIKVKY